MEDKELFLLHGAIQNPPFSEKAQDETGYLLRRLQQGKTLTMPHSRPMPIIGARCHELRVRDQYFHWRIIYRIDTDAILVADVFPQKRKQRLSASLPPVADGLQTTTMSSHKT